MQIDKSHPIHVRNDNAKKRRKVCAPPHPAPRSSHAAYRRVPPATGRPVAIAPSIPRDGTRTPCLVRQATLPEVMVEVVPRFGPAAKAARAKEKELEVARLAKEKRDAAPAVKAVPKASCVPHAASQARACALAPANPPDPPTSDWPDIRCPGRPHAGP